MSIILTKPNSEQQKDIIIESLRHQNAQLKVENLILRRELPTDDLTRKKHFLKHMLSQIDIHISKKINESA